MISNVIVNACSTAHCFWFIADETTDVAANEQMAFCLRFYDEHERRIRESIGSAEYNATTGKAFNRFLPRTPAREKNRC